MLQLGGGQDSGFLTGLRRFGMTKFKGLFGITLYGEFFVEGSMQSRFLTAASPRFGMTTVRGAGWFQWRQEGF
jgi:hypothetical protein